MKQDASPNYDQVLSEKWVESSNNRKRVTNSFKNKTYDGVVCPHHPVNKKTGMALPTRLLALLRCLTVRCHCMALCHRRGKRGVRKSAVPQLQLSDSLESKRK